MKKRSEWVCAESCPVTENPCSHLERLLPSMRDKKLQRMDTQNMTVDVFQAYRPTFELSDFEALMRGFGFYEEWDLQLLVARYYYGESLRQIEKQFSYMSYQTVKRRLKALHVLLVERGFKPRRRK